MIGAIWESPLTMRAIIEWRALLLEHKVLPRDIIDLNATYGGTPGDYHSAPDGEGDKAESEKDQRLKELKGKDSWNRGDYVQEQGWATMPGEKDPERTVARKCADLLSQLNE